MKASVNEHGDEKKEKVMSVTGENPYDSKFHGGDVQKSKGKGVDVIKRRRIRDIEDDMKSGTGNDGARWHETDMALAMWFYDACIPLTAVNSPYYQSAINKVASTGHGYIGPSCHALRVPLLKEAKLSVQNTINSMRSKWADSGCTIMGDSWTDNKNRALMNFLVYCPQGVSFIKSVDISGIEANAENLCNLFTEIVEIVGAQNMVHMVTDNAPNYKMRVLC